MPSLGLGLRAAFGDMDGFGAGWSTNNKTNTTWKQGEGLHSFGRWLHSSGREQSLSSSSCGAGEPRDFGPADVTAYRVKCADLEMHSMVACEARASYGVRCWRAYTEHARVTWLVMQRLCRKAASLE